MTKETVIKMDIDTQARNIRADFSEWEELYTRAKHWKADLEFYHDEMNFLRTLIDKYFLWLIESKNIDETKILTQKLSAKDDERLKLSVAIEVHLQQLEDPLKNATPADEEWLNKEHSRLREQFTEFIKTFKSAKRDVFKITEHVMETEKIKRLLNS